MVSVERALYNSQKCEASCEGQMIHFLCIMHFLAQSCSWCVEERHSQLIHISGDLPGNTCQVVAPCHKLRYFIKFIKFSCVATAGGAVSQLVRNFDRVFLKSVERKKEQHVLQVSS